MFKLIRWLIGVAVLSALAYVVVAVPFGDKTLWQHLGAIAGTDESQEMIRQVKRKAKETIDDHSGSDEGELTKDEQKTLRKLIRKQLKAEARDGATEAATRD